MIFKPETRGTATLRGSLGTELPESRGEKGQWEAAVSTGAGAGTWGSQPTLWATLVGDRGQDRRAGD